MRLRLSSWHLGKNEVIFLTIAIATEVNLGIDSLRPTNSMQESLSPQRVTPNVSPAHSTIFHGLGQGMLGMEPQMLHRCIIDSRKICPHLDVSVEDGTG